MCVIYEWFTDVYFKLIWYDICRNYKLPGKPGIPGWPGWPRSIILN